MDVASRLDLGKVFPGCNTPLANRAMLYCQIAFDAFFEDTKNLVSMGVQKDIQDCIASALSCSQRDSAISHGKLRESCMKSWLEQEFPLAYGKNGGSETYKLLVQAVAPDPSSIVNGLPNWNENCISPFDLVDMFYNMSHPTKPSQPRAPVLQTGSFLPVLKIAHSSLISLSNRSSTTAQKNFVKNTFRAALTAFSIHFFPSHLPQSHSSGSPRRKPVYNSWGYLGTSDRVSQTPLDNFALLSRPSIPPETIALNNAIANDCNSDWALKGLSIRNIKSILHKKNLPIDFVVVDNAKEPYVNDTYKWVKANYNGSKPLHHLALIVAIITSTCILPKLFIPKNQANLFKNASKEGVQKAYNSLDWISKEKKGMADKNIFIGMFTGFIIALYERESPLRKKIGSSNKGGLGDGWTTKHCMPFFFSPFFYIALSA